MGVEDQLVTEDLHRDNRGELPVSLRLGLDRISEQVGSFYDESPTRLPKQAQGCDRSDLGATVKHPGGERQSSSLSTRWGRRLSGRLRVGNPAKRED